MPNRDIARALPPQPATEDEIRRAEENAMLARGELPPGWVQPDDNWFRERISHLVEWLAEQ